MALNEEGEYARAQQTSAAVISSDGQRRARAQKEPCNYDIPTLCA